MKLCLIDQNVLANHEARRDWRDVPGIRSKRRYLSVLRRARFRKAHGA